MLRVLVRAMLRSSEEGAARRANKRRMGVASKLQARKKYKSNIITEGQEDNLLGCTAPAATQQRRLLRTILEERGGI